MMSIREPSSRSGGVTLLELLIVISIMAFAVAIVLPMLGGGGASTAELKSAARELASGLRYARGQAIVQRGEAFLVLDIDARTFRIPPDAKVHQLSDKIGIKLFTAQRDLVNEKVGAIRFYPDGGSNGGRITLAAGERKFDVDVDWLTGRVAILD